VRAAHHEILQLSRSDGRPARNQVQQRTVAPPTPAPPHRVGRGRYSGPREGRPRSS